MLTYRLQHDPVDLDNQLEDASAGLQIVDASSAAAYLLSWNALVNLAVTHALNTNIFLSFSS